MEKSRLQKMAGLSRGIMRPSESVIRVLATMIPPVEVSVYRHS